jgi:hypothetical protein
VDVLGTVCASSGVNGCTVADVALEVVIKLMLEVVLGNVVEVAAGAGKYGMASPPELAAADSRTTASDDEETAWGGVKSTGAGGAARAMARWYLCLILISVLLRAITV